MFGLGLTMALAYWPGWMSPAVSPRLALISVVAPALLLWRQEAIPFTRAHFAGCALLAWMALTVLWSVALPDSIDALWQVAILPAVCFCLGSQLSTLRPLFVGAAIGLAASSALVILQWSWPHVVGGAFPLPETYGPSGLFVNRNTLAETAALVAVGLAAERIWWPLPLLAPSLLLTGSRAAVLALGSVLIQFRRTIAIVAAMAGLFALFSIGRLASITERVEIWANALAGITLFGHGIGTYWAVHATEIYPDGVLEHAHNDFLELANDLGIVGAALAVWFIWELRGPLDTARLVLCALAIEALFSFPLHMPVTLALGSLCAGHAVRRRPVLRREPLRRGILLRESHA
jgi:hypothetical protein